ncbi:MAG: hypothetical protein ATN31_06290 [Candidatus Epulonipiscioides saccharophilum]|nr:MAG: hypothetical protein ATN31_06290 [Epulopiscium sp. AS2M-Bin001]
MKKILIGCLLTSSLIVGCSAEQDVHTVIQEEVKVADEITTENQEQTQKPLEIIKEDENIKLNEIKEELKSEEVKKEEVKEEEPIGPVEYHVYGTEIPWDNKTEVRELAENEFSTIIDALAKAKEGDTIIVHEGIYRETLIIKKDNITVKAYEDDYVLISANAIVTGFVPEPTMPGVYVADVPSNYKESTVPFTQVLANGQYQNMARFPNITMDDMMMPVEDGSGYSQLTKIAKPEGLIGTVTFAEGTLPDVDLTDAIFRGLVGKNADYVIGDVVNSENNKIDFTATTINHWSKTDAMRANYHETGFGYVFHKNLLDIPGEWFVEDRKIYYMPHGDIKDIQIEMQVRPKTFIINNTENVKLENLNFVSGAAHMKNTNGATIDGCSMRYLSGFFRPTGYGIVNGKEAGVYLENAKNNTITNTYLGHTWGPGFTVIGGENNTFKNNIIEDTGWIGIFTAGIYSSGQNTHIEDCTFRDTGRFHIRVDQPIKINIIHSSFERAMKLGEDAGAIQITGAPTPHIATMDMKGSEIAYNRINDVHGIPVFSGNYKQQFAVAFYFEECSNYTAHHNLIYDIRADSYDGPENFIKEATFLYIGPRWKATHLPINFYNNTIWNVDGIIQSWCGGIGNYDELKEQGLKQEEDRGMITNGHFKNNVFSQAPMSINFNAQDLTLNAKFISWSKMPQYDWIQILSYDIDEFFRLADTADYNFHPEQNKMFPLEQADQIFVDAPNGDFRLAENSELKEAGVIVDGYTSSDSPDIGALEGNAYVLSAGASLKTPIFKEVK